PPSASASSTFKSEVDAQRPNFDHHAGIGAVVAPRAGDPACSGTRPTAVRPRVNATSVPGDALGVVASAPGRVTQYLVGIQHLGQVQIAPISCGTVGDTVVGGRPGVGM